MLLGAPEVSFMRATRRRVVISGLGVISSLGQSVSQFWESLLEGCSGIDYIQSFDASVLPTRIAGEVRNFRAEDYVEKRKSIKVMGRHIQLAVAAAKRAVEDARLVDGSVDATRLGVSIGTGMLHADLQELQGIILASLDEAGQFSYELLGSEGTQHTFPLWLLKYIPNMTASHISIFHNAQGPSNTITTLCTSAAHALGEAFWIIRRSDADCMIAGGADARLNPLSMVKYVRLGLLTTDNDPPQRASRPFDVTARGIVIGEGAGILILEELEHARRRGAPIYAEITGYGAGCDACNLLEPHPSGLGLRIAIENAMADAGLGVGDIGCVSAAAMSLPAYDRAEATALKDVFGGRVGVPVSAIKSMLGHTHAASGALAAIAAAMSLRESVVPPTINLHQRDPICDFDCVCEGARKLTLEYALINNTGFGGNSACLILRRFADQTDGAGL